MRGTEIALLWLSPYAFVIGARAASRFLSGKYRVGFPGVMCDKVQLGRVLLFLSTLVKD